ASSKVSPSMASGRSSAILAGPASAGWTGLTMAGARAGGSVRLSPQHAGQARHPRFGQFADFAVVGQDLLDAGELAFQFALAERTDRRLFDDQSRVFGTGRLELGQSGPVLGACRGEHLRRGLGHGFVESENGMPVHGGSLAGWERGKIQGWTAMVSHALLKSPSRRMTSSIGSGWFL